MIHRPRLFSDAFRSKNMVQDWDSKQEYLHSTEWKSRDGLKSVGVFKDNVIDYDGVQKFWAVDIRVSSNIPIHKNFVTKDEALSFAKRYIEEN